MPQRVVLNPGLPPQTAAYKRFETATVELNRFYWTFRCAADLMLPAVGAVANVRDVVKTKSGEQLDIPSSDFIANYPETERVARNSFLVLSVTAYEDYIKAALEAFLVKNWRLKNRTYRLSFKPQDLPAPGDIHNWLREKSIQTIIDDCLGKPYSDRTEAISKLVVNFGACKPALPPPAQALASQACEARNNIVHCSGIADSRVVVALRELLPGLKIGDPLNVSESLLWQFLGALRDSARALDVSLRSLPPWV